MTRRAACCALPSKLAAWLFAGAVLPGSTLTLQAVQGLADGDYERGVVRAVFEPCPRSSDFRTLAMMNHSLRKWQGKRIAIVGDSLSDLVYDTLVCSGVLLGARIPYKYGQSWPPQQRAQLIHSNGTASRPVRVNELVFEDDRENAIAIQQIRFYDFPLGANQGNARSTLWDEIFGDKRVDVLFMNLAHEAYFHLDQTDHVSRELVGEAAARGCLAKVILFGHPPQHFDTETGGYTKDAQVKGGCRCHGQELMKRQASWGTNGVMSRVAHELKVPFVDPWPYYADGCKNHIDDHDCTHFRTDLSLHAMFVAELLRVGEDAIGGARRDW